MPGYEQVAAIVEEPNYNEKVIKDYQSTRDIIKDLIYCFKKYNYQAKPIRQLFSSGDFKTDAKNIYDFIKKNIHYEAEPEGDQTTRSFSRIIHDKWGDCKHNALLAASIAWNMGYNVIFKFVGYNKGESYGHVYTIIENPKTKEEIIIDPLQDFNYEKPYLKAVRYKAVNQNNKLMLSRLTGIAEENTSQLLKGVGEVYHIGEDQLRLVLPEHMEGIGRKKGKLKALLKKDAAKVKAGTKKLKANIKKHGGLVKTIYLAPVRGATSALLLENFRGFASRFVKLPEAARRSFAKKFGYNFNTLMNQANKGAKKKPFLEKVSGVDEMPKYFKVEGVGFVITASAVAAAAPAIIVLTKLYKDHKLDSPKDVATAAAAAADVASGNTAATTLLNTAEGNQQQPQQQQSSSSAPAASSQQSTADLLQSASDTANQIEKKIDEQNKGEKSNVPAEPDSWLEKAKSFYTDQPVLAFTVTGLAIIAGGKIIQVVRKKKKKS